MSVPMISGEDSDRARNRALSHFQHVSRRLQSLRKRSQGISVKPGSSLAADDLATRSDALSYQARGLLTVTGDHLQTLTTMINRAKTIPPFASFTLLRGALECTGTALWLVGPRSRDERIIRALSLTFESLDDDFSFDAARAGTKYEGIDPDNEKYQQLLELRAARSAIAPRSLRPPKITERMAKAQPFMRQRAADRETLVIQWRRASGLTHARRGAVWRNSEALLAGVFEANGAATMVRADMVAVAEHYEASMDYFEDSIDLLETRAIGA